MSKRMIQRCDRCGKVAVTENYEGITASTMKWVELVNIIGEGYRTVDLCPECVKGLLEYLGMEYHDGKTEEG